MQKKKGKKPKYDKKLLEGLVLQDRVSGGLTIAEISEKYGISDRTVYRILGKEELKEQKTEVIAHTLDLRQQAMDDWVYKQAQTYMSLSAQIMNDLDSELRRVSEMNQNTTNKQAMRPRRIVSTSPYYCSACNTPWPNEARKFCEHCKEMSTRRGGDKVVSEPAYDLERMLKVWTRVQRPFFEAQKYVDQQAAKRNQQKGNLNK